MIIFLSLFVLAGILVFKESRIKRPEGFSGEACLFCHKEMSDSDRSHPAAAFGCSSCHLGNPYSFDEKRAHTTLVKNPGDLRVVDITCGKSGCHGEIAGRVKKSLMATNRGILRIVQDEWGNGDGGEAVSAKPLAVRDLYGITPPRTFRWISTVRCAAGVIYGRKRRVQTVRWGDGAVVAVTAMWWTGRKSKIRKVSLSTTPK